MQCAVQENVLGNKQPEIISYFVLYGRCTSRPAEPVHCCHRENCIAGLTKLDVLAALCLKLLTSNSDLTALAVVEDGWSINRACTYARQELTDYSRFT